MTKEQERLVLENRKLVPYIFGKLAESEQKTLYREDLLAEGYVGLTRAARSFDPKRGLQFSTYAGICIRNEMCKYLRRLNKFGGKERLMSAPAQYDSEGGEIRYEDVLSDKTDYAETVSRLLDVRRAKLTMREVKILEMKYRGFTREEIAAELGLTQNYISHLMKKIKNKIGG